MAHADKVAAIAEGRSASRVKVDDRDNMKPGRQVLRVGAPRRAAAPRGRPARRRERRRDDRAARQPREGAAAPRRARRAGAGAPAIAIQKDMLERARAVRDERTGDVATLDELAEKLESRARAGTAAAGTARPQTEAEVKERDERDDPADPPRGQRAGGPQGPRERARTRSTRSSTPARTDRPAPILPCLTRRGPGRPSPRTRSPLHLAATQRQHGSTGAGAARRWGSTGLWQCGAGAVRGCGGAAVWRCDGVTARRCGRMAV